MVVFEAGKAAFLSVTAPGFTNSTADREAVLRWMNAPDTVDFDRTHNFTFELGVWAPGAQARQFQRRQVALAVADTLPAEFSSASSNYTWLAVMPRQGSDCSRKAVQNLIKNHKELKSSGFEIVECGFDGMKVKVR